MTTSLHISLLGHVQITLAGKPLTGLPSRKAEALLIYLVCNPGPRSREALATLLWPDQPQNRALANLSVLLTSLRKQLAPFLLATSQTIGIQPESGYWLDVAEFEQKVVTVRSLQKRQGGQFSRVLAGQLAEAATLYRGDFLTGLTVREAAPFDEWATLQRERLQRLMAESLQELVNFYQGRQMYQEGVSTAQRLLGIDPLREMTHRQLMQLLAASNHATLALQQYETCCQVLWEELGVEPEDATTAVYEAIKHGTPLKTAPLATTPLHNLPAQLTSFVGREAEMAHIHKQLRQPACRLFTLVGAGGVGKSSLALQAATSEIGEFLHGVWFVSLAGLSSAKFLPTAIAEALDVALTGKGDAHAQLLAYLRQKEMLLVLDNFEHLLEGANWLVELLQQSPELKLLLTSRERLNVSGEWLLALEGLPYPPLEARQTADFAAVQLFLQTSQRVDPHFALTPETETAVSAICRLVEGMPLAIELAATWVRYQSCEDIAQMLLRELINLQTTLRDLPLRHRSLRATFEYSWQLLSQPEQQIWARLSLFRGGFSTEAAEFVAQAKRPFLISLIDKSLIQRQTNGRYHLHEALRQFAAEKLGEGEEKTAVQSRHSTYFAQFLQQQETRLRSKQQKQALETIALEFENIRLAWRGQDSVDSGQYPVNRGDFSGVLEMLLHPVYLFCLMRSRYQDGYDLFAQALQSLPAQDLLRGKLLARQCALYTAHSQLQIAQQLAQETLGLLRLYNNLPEIAFTLTSLAKVHLLTGQYDEAQKEAQEALDIYQQLNDLWGIATCFGRLSDVYYYTGNHPTARELNRQSLSLFRQIEDTWSMSRLLDKLGIVEREIGEYQTARQLFQESLLLCQQFGDLTGMAYAYNHLGSAAYYLGNAPEAAEMYRESIILSKEVGEQRILAFSLTDLGGVLIDEKQFAQARVYLAEASVLFGEIGDKWGMALNWGSVGRSFLAEANTQEAMNAFLQAIQTAHDIQAVPVMLENVEGVAETLAHMGRLEEAVGLLTWPLYHPSVEKFTQELATQLLEKLKMQVAEEQISAVLQQHQSGSLEEVVIRLLSSGFHLQA